MRTGWGSEAGDCRFDLPPRFGLAERRLAGLAEAAWEAGGRRRVAGFAGNSVLVAAHGSAVLPDGDGPVVVRCGAAIGAAFGIAPGMALAGHDGLAADLVAACGLLQGRPRPVPLETRLSGQAGGVVRVRGIALPLFDGSRATGFVQIVLNWQEGLNRAAAAQLKREIDAVLRQFPTKLPQIDPFFHDSAG